MIGILFVTAEQLQADLQKLGVTTTDISTKNTLILPKSTNV
jgi:hypothetical protein